MLFFSEHKLLCAVSAGINLAGRHYFAKKTVNLKMANVSSPTGNINNLSLSSSSIDVRNFYATVVGLSFEIFLALFGNSLVILAFYRSHFLRTVTNFFVVSLAVADVLVASLSMPCWLFILVRDIKNIPKGDQLSQTAFYYSWQFVDILCSTASIVNLCMISIDRHMAISSPLTYQSRMTPKRAKASIAFGWLYAFLCASLSIVTVVKPVKITAGPVYRVFISFAAFFIPLCILIVVYGKIFFVSLRQVRLIRSNRPVIQSGFYNENTSTFRRELKVTKILGGVVGAFITCWAPFFSMVFVTAVCPSCPTNYNRVWVKSSKWLHYSNSLINPLIYVLFTQSFRAAFQQILRGFCCKWDCGIRDRLRIPRRGSVEPAN